VTFVLDTGPLVALVDRRDRYHSWAREVLTPLEPPVFTCEPVLTEACFLSRNLSGLADAVLDLVARGLLDCRFQVISEIGPLRALMNKFADVPMTLADACLVRMAELDHRAVVVTLDSDFRVYSRNRRQIVPTIMPD
jgi:uncharacterized protein